VCSVWATSRQFLGCKEIICFAVCACIGISGCTYTLT